MLYIPSVRPLSDETDATSDAVFIPTPIPNNVDYGQQRIGSSSEEEPLDQYRQGGEGFIKWANRYAYIPIYPPDSDLPVWTRMGDLPSQPNPQTGRSYEQMWLAQQEILLRALEMKDKRFRYRLIVLCWMRGEGKSLVACLVKIWKWMCWDRQQIMLGANSKDQIKFVHFDIIRDVLLNSPELLHVVGKRNIREKEIRLRDKRGNIRSIIRAISSFSGIVSNITGYTFSEIFDMKNPKFYVQLDGSIRTMPNAFGLIDSTVSDKQHVLYQLYEGHRLGKLKEVFFSYRCSPQGMEKDFWNPNMTQSQLDDYRVKFPFGEFERYFGNLWSAGHMKVFTEEMVEAWEFVGADDQVGNQGKVLELLGRKNKLIEQGEELAKRGVDRGIEDAAVQAARFTERLVPISDIWSLTDTWGGVRMASLDELNRIGDKYDTDWSIGVGIDRADPMKVRTFARSILTVMAKGLPGSRSNPFLHLTLSPSVPHYLYCLLYLVHVESSSLEDLKEIIRAANDMYDGVDVVCGERWGMWDVAEWCEQQDIKTEIIFPTYDRQRDAFAELFLCVKQGRFKSPPIPVPGSKQDNILREEALMFDHDAEKRWFGSTEKSESGGIQDDAMFSLAWGMYGVRNLGVDDFRNRKGLVNFGVMLQNRELVGKW